MASVIVLHFVLLLAGIGFGSNSASLLQADEVRWAKRLGVKPVYVSGIVRAAGFVEDDEVRIDNLDIRHLSRRKHILLVTAAGNGHCLTLTVVTRKEESLEKVWQMYELNGAGFCHVGAYSGDFSARANADGFIIVDVPKFEGGTYPRGKYVLGVKQLVYVWNGKTYVVRKRREASDARRERSALDARYAYPSWK
jgi:hypothetical protein